MAEQRYCSKCRKTMGETNFYTYKNGTKCELCKSCLTMHVDNYDPNSVMWLFEKFDVPYIESVWIAKREKEFEKNFTKANTSGASDPKTAAYKMTRGSGVVFGSYLSTMKLNQHKGETWADTERLRLKAEEEARLYGTPAEQMQEQIAEMKERYEKGEISEAQWLTYSEINPTEENAKSLEQRFLECGGPDSEGKGQDNPYPVNEHPFEQVSIPDVGADLTEEDKVYLAMRWGALYSAADWVALEKSYQEYEKSFNLRNADLIAGTKQLCKLDLKGNQALDCGDIDSYSKLARASDALRKSLKFTEAQRKEDKETEFSCYGQIVAWAEMNNDEDYIRPIDLSIDRDIVDKDIRDIKNYTKSLIEDDPTVFKLIEQYIKKRESLAQQEQDKLDAEDGNTVELTDDDFVEYRNFVEEQKNIDNDEDEEEEDV